MYVVAYGTCGRCTPKKAWRAQGEALFHREPVVCYSSLGSVVLHTIKHCPEDLVETTAASQTQVP